MKIKTSWIGLGLIGVMLFSTFAYAILQGGRQPTIELPKSNIVDYRLNPILREALIQNGATIITFEYNLGCVNCVAHKSYLESVTQDYKEQILLEEILNETLDSTNTTIASTYGVETLIDANETGTFGALCKLMLLPPATCAITQ